jgi:GNAT superfamily N-acetyltransferase
LTKTFDYQRIALMDATLFRGDHPIEGWHENAWWIGTEGGVNACYCGIKQLDEDTGYMTRSGVIREFQGKGYQKRMIRARIKWAKEQKLKFIITDTVIDNPASVNSLISMGFKQYVPQAPWKGPDALYWIREIT